jgi:hypothetical protein
VFASRIRRVFVRPDVSSVVILLHFRLQWFDIAVAFAYRQSANAGLIVEEDLHLGRCKSEASDATDQGPSQPCQGRELWGRCFMGLNPGKKTSTGTMSKMKMKYIKDWYYGAEAT